MATKKTTTVPKLTAPGVAGLPMGMPFVVYERGVENYDSFKLNGPVELTLDDGSVQTGTVQERRVGPLIDLLLGTGPQSLVAVGRAWTPLSLVEALTEQGGGDVLDVTRLYTAVSVSIPVPGPMTPTA